MNTDTNYADLFFSNIPNDVYTLENNVKEYPFSSVARFLLLYHYKKHNNPAFENFARQTGIYINNPFWLQYQLSKTNDGSSSNEDYSKLEVPNKNGKENITGAEEKLNLPAADKQIMQIPISENEVSIEDEIKNNSYQEEKPNESIEENIPVTAEEQIMQIPVSENEVLDENGTKNNSFEEEKQNENIEENIPVTAEEQIMQIPVSENEVLDENGTKNNSFEEEKQNENIEENIPVTAEEQIMQIPVSENDAFNEHEAKNSSYVEEKQNDPAAVEREMVQLPVSQNEGLNENEIENNSHQEENRNENIEENISVAAQEEISQIPVSEKETQEVPGESQSFEPELKNPENNEEDIIPFEPLHTVDYFASQGIKISEEALENDHLGQQVKSFTAWLKSMKKLHPGQLPEQNDVIEKIIQANAEVSNQNANVLTEAMAEVLVKQNKKEKAIEMYQKLSLINPSKSAYFAGKIESLKII